MSLFTCVRIHIYGSKLLKQCKIIKPCIYAANKLSLPSLACWAIYIIYCTRAVTWHLALSLKLHKLINAMSIYCMYVQCVQRVHCQTLKIILWCAYACTLCSCTNECIIGQFYIIYMRSAFHCSGPNGACEPH